MNEDYYVMLNANLGAEFDLFALEHADWMEQNVPRGAVVVLQTDDAGFNCWARGVAEKNRHLENPPRPMVLIHIRELLPQHSRIVKADAELIAT